MPQKMRPLKMTPELESSGDVLVQLRESGVLFVLIRLEGHLGSLICCFFSGLGLEVTPAVVELDTEVVGFD